MFSLFSLKSDSMSESENIASLFFHKLKSFLIKKPFFNSTLFCIISILFFFPALPLAHASNYLWPIEGYRDLTGTFGEFRYGHFHAGIDISTRGKTGIPVRAIEPGFVYRIRTSPAGYGRAVYIRLKDGNIAVYAHLSRFTAKIERWIQRKQLENHDFSLDVYPETNTFPVRKGEVIGYSGESGNVPPHLHFELRENESQPINPLNFMEPASTNTRLCIAALAVNPLGIDSTVDESWETKVYPVEWDKAKRCYVVPQAITVWGECGIEVVAYGLSRGCRIGVRNIKLFVNDQLLTLLNYESFSYAEFCRNYQVVDRELFLQGKGKFQRLYTMPKNSLPFYRLEGGKNGILSTASLDAASGLHPGQNQLKIIVEDDLKHERSLFVQLVAEPPFFQNQTDQPCYRPDASDSFFEDFQEESDITFFEDFLIVEATTTLALPFAPRCSLHQGGKELREISLFPGSRKNCAGEYHYFGRCRLIPYADGPGHIHLQFPFPKGKTKGTIHPFVIQTVSPEKGGTVVSDDGLARITFEPDEVATLIFPQVRKQPIPSPPPFLEPVGCSYQFTPLDQTFHPKATISLRYPELIENPEQVGIFYRDRDPKWHYLSSRNDVKKKTITSKTPFFAEFALLRDAIPPVITPLLPDSGALVTSRNPKFSARLEDKGTGIDYGKTVMLFDGVKVPAEYIPKKHLFRFTPVEPLKSGSHTLRIITSDLVGNTSDRKVPFTVKNASVF